MFAVMLFILSLSFVGSALSYTYRWFSRASVGANILFGLVAGGLVAAIVLLIWRRFATYLEDADIGIRVTNAIALGVACAVVGVVVYFALGVAFGSSAAVHAAQGGLLAGTLIFGLRVGFELRAPFWRAAGERVSPNGRNRKQENGKTKILDTSVIIDGRVGDLVTTGFLEGEILIPEFVLAELQNIADSSDSLRRRKGRRGLEILRQLMEDDSVKIQVVTHDYPSIREVDRKLIRLAQEEHAVLVTTDYNLNRVAQVEGVSILNVNELASAIKPRFIPGEHLELEIIDRGAEINQGVGYLDDGTMVVVENGRRHIGRTIKATVKSTLQTEAGRMLFVEPANEMTRWER